MDGGPYILCVVHIKQSSEAYLNSLYSREGDRPKPVEEDLISFDDASNGSEDQMAVDEPRADPPEGGEPQDGTEKKPTEAKTADVDLLME